MNLSQTILDYAKSRGQFNFHEIYRYCQEQGNKQEVLYDDSTISSCLRRLKGHGYLLNKRNTWYFKQSKKPNE